MSGCVKDDAWRRRAISRFSVLSALAALGSWWAIGIQTAAAQPSGLEAQVRAIETERNWIHLPVNRSVLIETNLPATRVQTLSGDIAQISSISPTQVLVTGQSFGRTQVIIWSGDQQKLFDVSVELELDQLREAIRQVDPHARVDAFPVLDTVVLSGIVSDADAADRIMQVAAVFATNVQNHLQVAGEQQVLLHVTIAEMSRSMLRQLGINGFLAGENMRDFPLVSNIGDVNPTSFGYSPGDVTQNLNLITPGSQVGDNPTLSFAFPRVQLQVFIQALRENGLIRILAEPNLVTTSGRTASFLAGGEFPIPVPQAGTGGESTITIEFKEFGTRLSFTPIVLSQQLIRMNLAPEVSNLDFSTAVRFSGFVVPGLNVRRTETTVEMGSGQTLAISGLLQETARAIVDKVPALGDLPVLGALFTSTEWQKQMTELAVLCTPEIVSPLNPDQVGKLPGEDYKDPDDWQLFALGMLDGNDFGADAETDLPPPAGAPAPLVEEQLTPDSPPGLIGPWGLADHEENQE